MRYFSNIISIITGVLMILNIFEFSEVTGLDCYQCLYLDKWDSLPINLPPGYSYGKKCSENKLPGDWKQSCPSSWTLSHDQMNVTDAGTESVCASIRMNVQDLPIWARGCVPKALIAESIRGKCSTNKASEFIDVIKELVPDLEDDLAPFLGVDIRSCFCDDKDACNSAIIGTGGLSTALVLGIMALFLNYSY